MSDFQPVREQAGGMETKTLGDKLRSVIAKLPPQGVTLAQIRDLVGDDGPMILVGLLSLVFLIPVSIPGVSTVFGAAILLVGISRLFGRGIWLPQRFRDRVVASDKLRAALQRALVWLDRLERISRPQRLGWLAGDGVMGVLNNSGLILAAILLMAPFGMIPFSNTLPALALLCLAIGLLQRDGVCVLLGYFANLLTLAYFTVLIAGSGLASREALQRFGG
jgi:hypothetical protein